MGQATFPAVDRNRPHPTSREWSLAALAGSVAIGTVLWLDSRLWPLAVAAAVAVAQACTLAPSLASRVGRTAARRLTTVRHGLVAVLTWVVLTGLFLTVVLPVAVLSLPLRRGPFGRNTWFRRTGWSPRPGDGRTTSPRRQFGGAPRRPAVSDRRSRSPDHDEPTPNLDPAEVPTAPPRPRDPRRLRLLTAFGAVSALLVADVTAGAILTGTELMPPSDRGELVTLKEASARSVLGQPNIRHEPWAEPFAEELAAFQLQSPTYVPYLVMAPHDFHGRYLNVNGGERASYRPTTPAGAEPLRVAFFGGSTTFGIGQRDEHTIPSEVARIAEDAGTVVEVHNYGFPAWVSWQEFQYLERLLAAGESFDLVVFYDGFNEFLTQRTEYSTDPTHSGASTLQGLASDFHTEHETRPGYLAGLGELVTTYRRNSGLSRLADRLLGTTPTPSWMPSASSATGAQQARAALDIYRRSHALTSSLAADHSTPVQFFWQPIRDGWDSEVGDRLPRDVIDISHALDGKEGDVYIGEVHTNEVGARLVAESMWDALAPVLEQLAGHDEADD